MHWKHSRFQVTHIILGNCHTYDEAYRIVCELYEDRLFSIDSALAESKRAQSKVVQAKITLTDVNESKAMKLLAEANIGETSARKLVAQPCMDEARRELAFLQCLKTLLNKYRIHRDLPDPIAHQLCQPIEWQFDLLWKAYNYMCSLGHIPYDHLMLIKMHPKHAQLTQAVDKLRCIGRNDINELHNYSKHTVLSSISVEDDGLIGPDFFSVQKVLEFDVDTYRKQAKDRGIMYYESTEEQADEVQTLIKPTAGLETTTTGTT